MEKLIKFIKENNLYFNEGERNTNITILVGFTIYLNDNDAELTTDDIVKAIKESKVEYQNIFFIEEEIERVFEFAEYSGYGDFWDTQEAEDQYTFEKIN